MSSETSMPLGRLKRFLVFAGSAYYADGGALDLRGSHDTLDKAIFWLRSRPADSDYADVAEGINWCHVLDTETGLVEAYVDGMCCGRITEWESKDRLSSSAIDLGTLGVSGE